MRLLIVEAGQNLWRRRGFRPTGGEQASGWAFERNPLISAQRATNLRVGWLDFCTEIVRNLCKPKNSSSSHPNVRKRFLRTYFVIWPCHFGISGILHVFQIIDCRRLVLWKTRSTPAASTNNISFVSMALSCGKMAKLHFVRILYMCCLLVMLSV
jgi:hypothetical protein